MRRYVAALLIALGVAAVGGAVAAASGPGMTHDKPAASPGMTHD